MHETLQRIFDVSVAVFIAGALFTAGLEVTLAQVSTPLRKLPVVGRALVANVVLARTKGHGGGWLLISAGWGLGVFTAVSCVDRFTGAHLNPAVTLGLALIGAFDWARVPGFVGAQLYAC